MFGNALNTPLEWWHKMKQFLSEVYVLRSIAKTSYVIQYHCALPCILFMIYYQERFCSNDLINRIQRKSAINIKKSKCVNGRISFEKTQQKMGTTLCSGIVRPFLEIFITRVAKCTCKYCQVCDGMRCVFSFSSSFISLKGITRINIVFLKNLRRLFLYFTY